MKPTVYVIQDSPGKNLLPARDYGSLKILLTHPDTKRDPVFVAKKLQLQLKDITPSDYLLLVGEPIAIGLATHIALHNTHGIVRVLRWVREEYRYEERIVEIII